MNTPKRRILFIGLDGADLTYMRPWLDEGELPNIASIIEGGALMPLTSTLCNVTNVAWPVLFTGKNPGKTGITDIALRIDGEYDIVPASLRRVQTEPFWVYLGEHDLRTLVVNVPMVYPPLPLKGTLISGFDTPEDASRYAWPDEVNEQLEKRGYNTDILQPQHRLVTWSSTHRGSLDKAKFLQACKALTDNTIEHVSQLLAEHAWDVAFIGYHGCDIINHYTADRVAHLQVYRMADELVGKLMDQVGDEVSIVIASDHGSMQAGRCVGLSRVLLDAGLIAFKPKMASEVIPWILSTGFPPPLSSPGLVKAMARLWDGFPEWLQRLLSWLPLRVYPGWSHYYSNIDWPNTYAYVTSATRTVYVNRSDVLPGGIVEPGPEYEALRDSLISSLEAVRDPNTQTPVFRVQRAEEVWHGPHMDATTPDLLISPVEDRYFIQQADPRGRAFWDEDEEAVGGTHRLQGILILMGEGILQGAILPEAHISDVVPTILHLMSVPLPLELDGKPITSAIDPAFLEQHPVVMASCARSGTYHPDETDYTEEDKQSVLEKLRGLGYIE